MKNECPSGSRASQLVVKQELVSCGVTKCGNVMLDIIYSHPPPQKVLKSSSLFVTLLLCHPSLLALPSVACFSFLRFSSVNLLIC